MRIVVLLIFLAGIFAAQAENTLASLKKINLYGREYVLATEWAKSNRIHLQWMVKDRELRATNETSRVILNMDSRFAKINGINFVLSCPVILEKKRVYISLVDLKATLQPVLFPEKMPTNTSIKIICLDAGHGGKDPGKLDGKNSEKRFTLLLAEEVERLLKQAGLKVVQTRKRDVYVERPDRPKIANHNGADLFVSLHYNAAASRTAQGAETYCLTPIGTSSSNRGIGNSTAPTYPGSAQNADNILLAYHVQKSLVKNMNVEDRGVKRAQWEVLLTSKMPAVLIEAGFMTNPSEAKRIYDSAYRKKMALAIVDGILNYKKVVEQ
ncbi:MAG: N-acetylmuramoyl-L-alanine amidase [Verrucomicrobiota bacterium]